MTNQEYLDKIIDLLKARVERKYDKGKNIFETIYYILLLDE